MNQFKVKQKKLSKNKKNLRVTLDVTHNKTVQKFKTSKSQIPVKKKKLKELKIELEKITLKNKTEWSDNDIIKYSKIKKDIILINTEIDELENNTNETDYFLNTAHLMFDYYELNSNDKTEIKPNSIISNKKTHSILDLFTKNSKKQHSKNSNKKQMSKTDIIEKYLEVTNSEHIKNLTSEKDVYKCPKCSVDRILYHERGIIICPKCGSQDKILVHSDKPSYKEPPKEVSCYSYKRINHFNEWLAQFQAKESTDIPQIVYDKILIEIKKERITNIATLKQGKLREILKKLKLNKYYEHVPHIINRLNGIQAPTMSREIEEKLRSMFKEIQTPFIKHCPKDRKNFLSYSYVLHKFVQLLGLDEYMSCFPLLKSREKLHQQDLIWKAICRELGWQFIKSL